MFCGEDLQQTAVAEAEFQHISDVYFFFAVRHIQNSMVAAAGDHMHVRIDRKQIKRIANVL